MFSELQEKYCTNCSLSKGCMTPEMQPLGPEIAQIYVLGEFPTENDDLRGKLFSGISGEILKTILEYLKIDPNKVRYNNAVQCRVKNGDVLSDNQINVCRPKIFKDIKKVKPRVIIALGNSALKSLFGRSEPGIAGWRGNIIPFHELNCWIVPTFPISTLIEDGISDEQWQWVKGTNHTDTLRVFREDLSIVPDLVKTSIPINKSYQIQQLLKFEQVLEFFNLAWQQSFFVFDFETLGLKPYYTNSCILTCSFSFNGEIAYALPISYYDHVTKKKYWNPEQEEEILRLLKLLLTKKRSIKAAHKSDFEMEWALKILGIEIENIKDSMLQHYILDCRKGTQNLGFITFINFGIRYKIYPDFIMNDLTQLPIGELLDYNGKDSIYEYRIYELQEKQLNKDKILYEQYLEQLEIAKTIAKIQYDGACTSSESRNNLLLDYKDKRGNLEKEILTSDSIQIFKNRYGKIPALRSNSKDIPKILFSIENLDPFKKTKKGNSSVDKEVLLKYVDKSEFCRLLLQYREYAGIEGKILKGYTDCVFPDNKYHPSFYPIETGRLGSSNISLQTLDKRKHPEIRQIIIAPDGYVLLIFDYGQLEFRVLAAVSNCRKAIDIIKTGYDIHLEKAIEIFGENRIKNSTKEQVKKLRYSAKNEFVFPSFYGAKPKSVAKWLNISEEHAQSLQDKLWSDFPEIKEWQNKILKFYEKNRYVEIPPGRKRYAPLTTNEILNTPIQGGAASIVSKAMNILSRKGYWIMINAHDELVFCVKENEAKVAVKDIQYEMEKKNFDFMIDVPLVVDGTIGWDWYNVIPNCEIFK